ncbi:hypothetical protein Sango_2664500 [Sesamum angolense]|uniref:Isopenicillin N synthase-like Fe(2+) 2OG dioxygenase domain-containing protein n=1 Tax=Sesamum angolense TaxID=2727404 RepID=A0AAE1W286_9LAMI|nr:hypothetical protein Sango_2664500 [Sesamum angolense]
MQQDEGLGDGTCSPIINVQEIVRSGAENVPERYIRNPEDRPKSSEISLVPDDHLPIINHGAEEALPKVKTAAAQFFDLPLSEKKKYAMPPDYFEGYGQDDKAEDRKRDWIDLLWLLTTSFGEAVEEYATEMQRVTYEILGNLSLLMGLELHGEVKQGTRMNYYPACARPDLVFALSPHCDYTSISFVLQDDDITALQIRANYICDYLNL